MDRREWVGMAQDWGLAVALTAGLVLGWKLLAPAPVGAGAAPELALRSTDGEVWSLREQRAQAYVVNFWATWCAPCRQEIPDLARFAREHPEVEVVGVSVDEGMATERLKVEAARLGVTYRVLHDLGGEAARAWGVSVYPTTFVLDATGTVVASRVGVVDGRLLEEMLPSGVGREGAVQREMRW